MAERPRRSGRQCRPRGADSGLRGRRPHQRAGEPAVGAGQGRVVRSGRPRGQRCVAAEGQEPTCPISIRTSSCSTSRATISERRPHPTIRPPMPATAPISTRPWPTTRLRDRRSDPGPQRTLDRQRRAPRQGRERTDTRRADGRPGARPLSGYAAAARAAPEHRLQHNQHQGHRHRGERRRLDRPQGRLEVAAGAARRQGGQRHIALDPPGQSGARERLCDRPPGPVAGDGRGTDRRRLRGARPPAEMGRR